ncbi:MAG: hypothetical protein ACOX9C_07150 [Kiritimatiellia bacterium]
MSHSITASHQEGNRRTNQACPGCRYSKDIVYNNSIWPEASDLHRRQIAAPAQKIPEVREQHPDSTLATGRAPPPGLRAADGAPG